MMKKMEYATQIAALVNGSVKEAEKANGVKRIGICIKSDTSNVAPCIYIDEMYKAGLSVEEAAEKVTEICGKNQVSGNMDVKEQMKRENLRARLYNQATECEVYRKADGAFDDLIIVPVIEVAVQGQSGSIKLNKSILGMMGLSADEAIDIALENSAKEATMQSMVTMVAAMMGMDPDAVPFPDDGTMVLTTRSQAYGAIALLSKAEELAERFPNGYVVLPSSVHEVIVRELDMDPDELSKLVQTVNAEQVDPEEQLSNHAYVVNAA